MKKTVCVAAACLFLLGSNLNASTILKFGFGADAAADFEGVNGILSTIDDGDAGTPGDQNTGLDFLGPFQGTPSIPVANASISFDGIILTNATSTVGNLVLQPTSGGSFKVWDAANSLLLSGTFGDGLLSGSLGGPATASLISLGFGTFDGGSLQNQLDPTSASVALSFTGVNGGAGLSVSQMPLSLNNFTSDATGLMAATVPEPASIPALAIGVLGILACVRRKARCLTA